MRNLPNTDGSNGYSTTPRKTGSFTEAFEGDGYRELIEKANAVSLQSLLKLYGITVDECNRKIVCPFPSHKGGRESTPSFYYYPQTNTFWCFGCKIGVGCCDFVAAKDKISKPRAAQKIIDLFNLKIDQINIKNNLLFTDETLDLLLEFSTLVRDFRDVNKDEKAFLFIEEICCAFDTINLKHNLNNSALKFLIDKLKLKIISYIG